jgi:DNA polymerase elongation subunit (family B)
MNKQEPKILYFDIENTPNLSWTWGKWQQDVVAFEREWYMLSFAYKWGDGRTQVLGLPDFKTYKKDPTNDVELVRKLWELIDEADIVIGHNIDAFDLKKANSRFLFHKLKPPSPYKTVDTLKIARKYFKLNSNKLGDLGELLGLGGKLDTGGISLWLGCMSGDTSSWRQMLRYNKKDVDLTHLVYHELKSWHQGHPNLNAYTGKEGVCPVCGSVHIQKRGLGHNKLTDYQRYQCKGCGSWWKGENISRDKTE